MKKILFTILTCNRFFYFKNCIESILQCFNLDQIDILICDNYTIEKGFDEYVKNIISKYKNIVIKKFTDRSPNELYRAMNFAVRYAKENKYEFINFIQDDVQFLYRNDELLENIISFFNNNKNIVQINSNLTWKYKIGKRGKIKNIQEENYHYGILKEKAVCDNGFTRVSVYDEVGGYPLDSISWGMEPGRYVNKINGEIWFGRRCRKKNYFRALLYEANCGMMFDCAYVRGDRRYGKYFPPPNQFYFEMLNEKQIQKIKLNSNNLEYSYIEDFCIPDGWSPKTYYKHGSIDIVDIIT